MKLHCVTSCVVKGGKIVAAGDIHDTGTDVPRKEDKEAFDLISSGRMVELRDTKAVEESKANLASAEKTKEAAKAATVAKK